ncbi:helix-turn-helix transcriptional regulator [Sphingomonas sp. AP4-R1]|nr:helix-turn-helix transcriptional regulator [Sphingomonas sp. AP4-R1]
MACDTVTIDPYRSLVFPNEVRRARKEHGLPRLLALSGRLPDIPYVRLSKIERGEVFAKPDEMIAVAGVLGVPPESLLIDIDTPDFEIGRWATDLGDWEPVDPEQDRFALMLGAAVRARRAQDDGLTIAAIEQTYRIAPVILSRIENAFKPFERWNGQTVAALCQLFGVRDAAALRKTVLEMAREGALDAYVRLLADPEARIAKSRKRIAELRTALANPAAPAAPQRRGRPARVARTLRSDPAPAATVAQPGSAPVATAPSATALAPDQAIVRLLPVYGLPLADGLIARTSVGGTVEAPRSAGPDAYGLRVCRPTLGLGLPASATVIVDPARFPSGGGIAVVEEETGLRLLAITFDRHGRMMGYSESPNHEVAIDTIAPGRIAMVIAAIL